MTEPIPVSLDEMIAEVKRELALRERLYPKWVSEKRMLQSKANSALAAMRAVLRTLINLKENPNNAAT